MAAKGAQTWTYLYCKCAITVMTQHGSLAWLAKQCSTCSASSVRHLVVADCGSTALASICCLHQNVSRGAYWMRQGHQADGTVPSVGQCSSSADGLDDQSAALWLNQHCGLVVCGQHHSVFNIVFKIVCCAYAASPGWEAAPLTVSATAMQLFSCSDQRHAEFCLLHTTLFRSFCCPGKTAANSTDQFVMPDIASNVTVEPWWQSQPCTPNASYTCISFSGATSPCTTATTVQLAAQPYSQESWLYDLTVNMAGIHALGHGERRQSMILYYSLSIRATLDICSTVSR